MQVKIQWATPNIDEQIMYMARISNKTNQDSKNQKLLYYLMKKGHVSPFDMANACLEIVTTRDISRQILRHHSIKFQEFSQRYAEVDFAEEHRECRMQDTQNRQNSLPCTDPKVEEFWMNAQDQILELSNTLYHESLMKGIAKEVARVILPEGLVQTKLYANGTMRSWIFYLKQRLDLSTQKEHRIVAEDIKENLYEVAPIIMDAFFGKENLVSQVP